MGALSLFQGKEKKVLPKLKNDIEDDPRYRLYEHKSLEELLDDLLKYGKHTLSWMGDGWFCRLELYVNVSGAELKIASEFHNRTHKHAVIECTVRLHETIDQINNTRNAR